LSSEPVTYRRRRNALSGGERDWIVEDDALVSRGSSGGEKRYRWKDFASVRLCHEPARFRPWRYVFELQPKQGRKIDLDNAHFVSRGEYEERSEAYTAFVRAALDRYEAVKPGAMVLIGETPKRYFFLLLLALLAFCALAYVLVAVRTPLDSVSYGGLIKLAIVLLMLPVFWRWVIGSMPRGVAMDAIPERALPPENRTEPGAG
jgi:hypothetical protein